MGASLQLRRGSLVADPKLTRVSLIAASIAENLAGSADLAQIDAAKALDFKLQLGSFVLLHHKSSLLGDSKILGARV